MPTQKRWNESKGEKNECDKPVKWFMETKQNKMTTKIRVGAPEQRRMSNNETHRSLTLRRETQRCDCASLLIC